MADPAWRETMILRSLAIALRKQDWVTVVIETLIVVFGVFIGLQANNWNEARQERVETHSMLERLERDFEQQLGLTERGIERQLELLEVTSRLINGIRAGQLDDETLAADLALVDSVVSIPGPSVAFQEMVSTGRLRLIRSEALRDELYAYDGYISLLRSQLSQIHTPMSELGRVIIRAKRLELSGQPSETFTQIGRVEAVDRAVLLEDADIMNALQGAYIIQDASHLALVYLQARIAVILELLAEERGVQED
jgi:prefoldin subunit 5